MIQFCAACHRPIFFHLKNYRCVAHGRKVSFFHTNCSLPNADDHRRAFVESITIINCCVKTARAVIQEYHRIIKEVSREKL